MAIGLVLFTLESGTPIQLKSSLVILDIGTVLSLLNVLKPKTLLVQIKLIVLQILGQLLIMLQRVITGALHSLLHKMRLLQSL